MGDYKPDWSAMSNDILADWIEQSGCCEFIPEVVRRLRAERAAVPDERLNCRVAGLGRGLCDRCAAGYYDECRYTHTAAPQPPEGARVVGGLTAQTFGEWCNTLKHAYMYITEREPGNAQYGIEKVLNELRAWQRKLAAPTLAGKEGA